VEGGRGKRTCLERMGIGKLVKVKEGIEDVG
jgi:hypothetical protein